MPPSPDSGPAAPPDAPAGLRLVPVQIQLPPVPQPPTTSTRALRGRHVLVIGTGRYDLLGHAARTLDVTRHLAGSAASVTLLAGTPEGPEGGVEPPGAVHVVHLDNGDRRRGTRQHTALARTAYEANTDWPPRPPAPSRHRQTWSSPPRPASAG